MYRESEGECVMIVDREEMGLDRTDGRRRHTRTHTLARSVRRGSTLWPTREASAQRTGGRGGVKRVDEGGRGESADGEGRSRKLRLNADRNPSAFSCEFHV
jgi:hypothetical protein